MNRITASSRFARFARHGVRLVAGLSLGVGGVLAGPGCQATDKQVIAQADEVHGELSKAVINDPQMANYIDAVGDRIVTTAGQMKGYTAAYDEKKSADQSRDWMFDPNQMKFHFVNSKTLNAFTTGGEHMYVYTELLRQTKDEAELAAVMSHEYAHVYARHVQNGMSRQFWSMLGAGAAAAAGYVAGGDAHGAEYAGYGAGLGTAVAGLASAGYSRDDETEADKIGFEIYVRAGWPPDEFAGFFRTLVEAENKGGGARPEFLSDHPATAKRVAAAEKWAAEYKARRPDWQSRLRPPVANQAEFAQIQRRSVELASTLPDDQSLSSSKSLASALPRSCLWPDEPVPPDAKRAQDKLASEAEQMQRSGK